MGKIGMNELLIVLLIVLIIFGPKALPKLGSSLGKTLGSFKKGLNENVDDDEEEVVVVKKKKKVVKENFHYLFRMPNFQLPEPTMPEGVSKTNEPNYCPYHVPKIQNQEKNLFIEELVLNLENQVQNQSTIIRNLEVQLGQLATTLSNRPQGTSTSNSEINTKDDTKECKVIENMSGLELDRSG